MHSTKGEVMMMIVPLFAGPKKKETAEERFSQSFIHSWSQEPKKVEEMCHPGNLGNQLAVEERCCQRFLWSVTGAKKESVVTRNQKIRSCRGEVTSIVCLVGSRKPKKTWRRCHLQLFVWLVGLQKHKKSCKRCSLVGLWN